LKSAFGYDGEFLKVARMYYTPRAKIGGMMDDSDSARYGISKRMRVAGG
jgi:hypothetical protein